MTVGEGRRSGGQPKSWRRCLLDDLEAVKATEGSTKHAKFVFGVEADVWTVEAKKADKLYRGVLEAAERFVADWHEITATLSTNRHATTTDGTQRNRKREGGEQSQGNRGGREQEADGKQGTKVRGRLK